MKKHWHLLVWLFIAMLATSANQLAAQENEKKQDDSKQQEKQDDDKDEMSIQDRMQEAQQAAVGGNMEEAIDLLRKVHDDFPDEIGVSLTYLGATQQYASQLSNNKREDGNEYYFKSAEVAREIMNNEDLPEGAASLIATCLYNEACSLGVEGKKEKAMKVLKEAFDYGFDKYDLAISDSDFGDLLETDEFKQLVADAEKSKTSGMLEKIATEIDEFETFDFDFVVDTMEADELSLESLRGKLVIVDFWSTSSPASTRETSSLVKLKAAHEDKLEIVGMAFERGDDDEAYDKVERYISRKKINYPCALGDEEIRDQFTDFEEYPTKIFIDRKGTVRFAKAGTLTFEELEAIVSKIAGDE